MQFPIDVAFCDRYGFVLHISELRPGRVSRFVFRSYFAIEADAPVRSNAGRSTSATSSR